MKLDALDHFTWLALRRIKSGAVTRCEDTYREHGRPLSLLLNDIITILLDKSLIQLSDPSPQHGLSQVSLTEAGTRRYSELCKKQRAALPKPLCVQHPDPGRPSIESSTTHLSEHCQTLHDRSVDTMSPVNPTQHLRANGTTAGSTTVG